MNATFAYSEVVAKDIRTFWFEPEQPVRYIAGQFTELYLPHANADNRGERRWFTLSSAPHERLLALTTTFSPGAGSSYKQTLDALKPGTRVWMAEPMGDFVLPKDKSIPLVFVAAGLGITPMYSMVKSLQATGEQRTLRLLYALGDLEDDAFSSAFTEYGALVKRIIKRPSPGYTGGTGTLETDLILDFIEDYDRSLLYIAGPELLVERLTKGLIKSGVNAANIISDYFPGYL